MTAQDVPGRGASSGVVALFDREQQAREALDALRSLGFTNEQFGLLVPGQQLSVSQTTSADVSTLLAMAASATSSGEANDVANVLLSLGLPDGEARFYADETREGRTLLVVRAGGRSDEVRKLVRDHGGWDVQSRGGEFIRGDGVGVRGGVGAQPVDITSNWDDFRSRYEMLWQQHYGTTDATWEQMEPIYRYAWQLANDTRYRGRPWSEVESTLERDWRSSPFEASVAWSDAVGPVRDVWEDVAQEALSGAEGGADRRISSAGSDQSVAARDLLPPRQGAA